MSASKRNIIHSIITETFVTNCSKASILLLTGEGNGEW